MYLSQLGSQRTQETSLAERKSVTRSAAASFAGLVRQLLGAQQAGVGETSAADSTSAPATQAFSGAVRTPFDAVTAPQTGEQAPTVATQTSPDVLRTRRTPFDAVVPATAALQVTEEAPAEAVQAAASEPAPQLTETEGCNGPVDPTLAEVIRSVAQSYGLPPVTILSAQSVYAGFTNPQTQSSQFISGLVQFPDGRTITAAEFFDSPVNNVALRMQRYAELYNT
jgi:hypothetical protein